MLVLVDLCELPPVKNRWLPYESLPTHRNFSRFPRFVSRFIARSGTVHIHKPRGFVTWSPPAGQASTSGQCLHARTFIFPFPHPREWISLREVEPFCLVANRCSSDHECSNHSSNCPWNVHGQLIYPTDV
ncbi:MAG: hypothetical protein ACXAEU_12185 [Candidatus Hodarchaeales archaeon]